MPKMWSLINATCVRERCAKTSKCYLNGDFYSTSHTTGMRYYLDRLAISICAYLQLMLFKQRRHRIGMDAMKREVCSGFCER